MEPQNAGNFLSRFGAGVGRGILALGTGGISEMGFQRRDEQERQAQQERQQIGDILQSKQPDTVKAAMLSRLSSPEAKDYVQKLLTPVEAPASIREFQAMQSLPEPQQQAYQEFKNPTAQITPYQQQQLDLERLKMESTDEYRRTQAQNQAQQLAQQAQAMQAAGRPQEAAALQKQAQVIVQQAAPKKLSATEQKEFYDAQDKVSAADGVIGALDDALAINDKAFSGVTAGTRAYMNRIPGVSALIPDEGANATTELDNIITGQALESLKVTFGAAPTEGERKILLDLQASVDKTPAERKIILQRAKDAATRRQANEQKKMEGISTGSIYTNVMGGNEPKVDKPQTTPLSGLTTLPAGYKNLGNGVVQGPDGKKYQVKAD